MTETKLIARLEAATEGSRRLDFEIAEAAGFQRVPEVPQLWYRPGQLGTWEHLPQWSTSIDAALSLVPEGWSWSVSVSERKTYPCATLGRSHPTNATVAHEGRTAPLAIVIASLRARSRM